VCLTSTFTSLVLFICSPKVPDKTKTSGFFPQAVSGEEPWCAGCQEKVLEAVGRMVRVLEEHKVIWGSSSSSSSVLHTGRSVLQLIGAYYLNLALRESCGDLASRIYCGVLVWYLMFLRTKIITQS